MGISWTKWCCLGVVLVFVWDCMMFSSSFVSSTLFASVLNPTPNINWNIY
jgi:hypothetical protein